MNNFWRCHGPRKKDVMLFDVAPVCNRKMTLPNLSRRGGNYMLLVLVNLIRKSPWFLIGSIKSHTVDGRNPSQPGMYKTLY